MNSSSVKDDSGDEMYSCGSDITIHESQYAEMMTRIGRRKSVSAEGYDPEADTGDEPRVVHPKSDQQRRALSVAISKILMFASLDQEQLQHVLDAMFHKQVRPGEHIIDEGDDGDNFYVIEKGKFDIFINDPITKNPVKKGTYNGSGSFGELALMYNCPRLATIVATTDGALWAMDRVTFRKIVVRNNALKRKKYETVLADIPLLSTLTPEERCKLADAMNTVSYKNGDKILEQGGPADYFYIVLEGHVAIKKSSERSTGTVDFELNKLGPGQYFGELALITNKPRAASVIADGPCTCAAIDVQAFERLMGPCKKLLMRNIPLYEQQLSQIYSQVNLNQ